MAVLTAVAIGAMAAGTYMSVDAAAKKAKALRQQGDYQSDMFDFNAKMSKIQAQDAIDRGDKEAQNYLLKGRQTIGSQRAALAAQGVDVSTGSAADVQADTAVSAAMGAVTIRSNAWREAMGYKAQGVNYQNQGFIAKTSAQNEARTTMLTGVAGGLQNLGSMGMAAYGSSGSAATTTTPTTSKNYRSTL